MCLNNIDLPVSLVAQLYGKVLVGDSNKNVKSPIKSNESYATHDAQKTESSTIKEPETDVYAKETLLETKQPETAAIKFLGKNDKNVLIVVHYQDVVHLPEEDLTFLTQLLNACKLTLQDVAIVNKNNHPAVDGTTIIQHFNSQYILLFGLNSDAFGLPFAIPDYQVQQHNQKTVIQSPSLFSIKDDKPGKGKLWAGLKKTFGV